MRHLAMSRRTLLRSAATAGAAALCSGRAASAESGSNLRPKEQAFLRAIECIPYRRGKLSNGKDRVDWILKLTTTDGVIGGHPIENWVAERLGLRESFTKRLDDQLKGRNILDHEGIWSVVAGDKPLTLQEIMPWSALDAACWDVHARMKNVPLYDLLGGKKRDSYPVYGDERWAEGMTAEQYARQVEKTAKAGTLLGTKLHLPGAHHRTVTVEYICTALRKIREYCGKEFTVFYDPHPENEAADSLADARKILAVLDECGYGWLEGALPIEPKDRWLPQWLTLRNEFKTRMQLEQAEKEYRPDMVAWAEAGALNVLTADDRYWGVTGIVRIVKWIRKHPEKGVWLNLHKNASYVNRMVTAALEPRIAPWLELTGSPVKDGRQPIPDWVGITRFDWDLIEKHRL